MANTMNMFDDFVLISRWFFGMINYHKRHEIDEEDRQINILIPKIFHIILSTSNRIEATTTML